MAYVQQPLCSAFFSCWMPDVLNNSAKSILCPSHDLSSLSYVLYVQILQMQTGPVQLY